MTLIRWFKLQKRKIFVQLAIYDYIYEILKEMADPEKGGEISKSLYDAVVRAVLQQNKAESDGTETVEK